MKSEEIKKFQKKVWSFYKKNARKFPWRNTKDPYKILVSEIMLQQTQTDRVVPYYKKWLKRFPNAKVLAKATFSEIYPYWQGLGYNRRALNLQKVAKKAVAEYKGKLPESFLELQKFPGIGPYTARAVSIFAHNRPLACIETNIRRVFIHHFFQDHDVVDDAQIQEIADQCMSIENSREWHWALMDYGAHLKSQVPNPNRRHKNYTIQSKFEGSVRQIRGAVLRSLALGPKLASQLRASKIILATLEKEELIVKKGKKYSLK